MYKKTIVLFCVFLTLLFAFAACKKHSSPYGVLIVDQRGMEHVIMTDASGETVVDNYGNLVEIMTDSGNKKPIAAPTENGTVDAQQVGAYETHPVTFPGIIENGDTAEDVCCKLTVPAGWEQIGSGILTLRNNETGALITIYSDIGGTATGAIEKLNQDLATLSMEGKYTQTDEMIDGVLVTRTEYELNGRTIISYLLVTNRNKVCRINCAVDADKHGAADIDAVVQQIHFK